MEPHGLSPSPVHFGPPSLANFFFKPSILFVSVFNFGCTGSSLLHGSFSSCQAGAILHSSSWASHRSDIPVSEHGL